MTRRLIVVDTETTSLDKNTAVILEIAAIDVESGEVVADFVPHVEPETFEFADPEALAINRYFERRLFKRALSPDATAEAYEQLADALGGQTLGGANPAYDAAVLGREFRRVSRVQFLNLQQEPWHYRLADLSAYAAGVLELAPTETPGLAKCCELLGVTLDGEHAHTALGDAEATAECFRRLELRILERHDPVPW